MCRYVAYMGEALSPAPLVFGGDHSLYRQSWDPRELLSGSVNADGYGVVWYHDGRPRRIAEARPIWHDEELQSTLEAIASTCIVAAVRNATPGQPVDRASLLPLVHDRFTFVLDGFVPDFHGHHMRELRADLPDDLYAALRSSTVLLTNSLYTSRSVHFAEEGTVLATERLDSAASWLPVDGHHPVEIGPEGVGEAELVFF